MFIREKNKCVGAKVHFFINSFSDFEKEVLGGGLN